MSITNIKVVNRRMDTPWRLTDKSNQNENEMIMMKKFCSFQRISTTVCVRACVCVFVCVRACVSACVRVYLTHHNNSLNDVNKVVKAREQALMQIEQRV